MSVMAVNLCLISSGIIRLLLGRMGGLAEIKESTEHGAGCMEPEEIANLGLRISE